ncbi:hypothetical protein MCUN1_002827 [Malassezia cuniculi]|uniref:PUM-HD domain-containing protein n=1 Tax=Malassezia cuniculi TaxID=948313 RepID=A0AAF0JCB2_9BASI|nr:hypothetical protein MCUN1_002827 [Malassezia cuniculi]
MTPVFNERFLFDDELETADDSTFVHKYNLTGVSDEFPTLRPDGFSAPLSTFSSALDLAPLSQTMPRQQRMVSGFAHPNGMRSPWANGDRQDGKMMSVNDLAASTSMLSVRDQPPLAAAPGGPTLTMHGMSKTFGGDLLEESSAFSAGLPLSAGAMQFGRQQMLAPGTRPVQNSIDMVSSQSISQVTPQLVSKPTLEGDIDGRGGRLGNRRKDDARRSKARPFDAVESEYSFGRTNSFRRTDIDLSAVKLEDLRGELSPLCRDQYGCRFLQKKLEEGVPAQCDMIFAETFPYFAELMTDPFGNYLCQKLLEHCTDAQRDQIVEVIAPDLVTISLNMHGTRAVQKTIDFLSTPKQTQAIIQALSRDVVTLIKDLNGNHVIQKCLNRLRADDNQFVYDAVAAKCVEVATHRHGCCVLQRCIDHASRSQRMQLVREITTDALTLVQDPFGNYVVQYVLDLKDTHYSEAITKQFVGHVCMLSVQKFSSNVIEKCIRVAQPETRNLLVEELIDPKCLEALLRDSYANYVVQTSLDYAEANQRQQLVECIRPILPLIRNTPYGKRIQSKLQLDNEYGSDRSRTGNFAPRSAPSYAAPRGKGRSTPRGRGKGTQSASYGTASIPNLASMATAGDPVFASNGRLSSSITEGVTFSGYTTSTPGAPHW